MGGFFFGIGKMIFWNDSLVAWFGVIVVGAYVIWRDSVEKLILEGNIGFLRFDFFLFLIIFGILKIMNKYILFF